MALLGWGPGRIVIVFRGTNSLKNVVADLQVQPQSPGIANGMCAPSITPCSIQHCNWHASRYQCKGSDGNLSFVSMQMKDVACDVLSCRSWMDQFAVGSLSVRQPCMVIYLPVQPCPLDRLPHCHLVRALWPWQHSIASSNILINASLPPCRAWRQNRVQAALASTAGLLLPLSGICMRSRGR